MFISSHIKPSTQPQGLQKYTHMIYIYCTEVKGNTVDTSYDKVFFKQYNREAVSVCCKSKMTTGKQRYQSWKKRKKNMKMFCKMV